MAQQQQQVVTAVCFNAHASDAAAGSSVICAAVAAASTAAVALHGEQQQDAKSSTKQPAVLCMFFSFLQLSIHATFLNCCAMPCCCVQARACHYAMPACGHPTSRRG
jgi:uncharacterized protein YsxB (DUF464 family)